jgi:hypothetical protein
MQYFLVGQIGVGVGIGVKKTDSDSDPDSDPEWSRKTVQNGKPLVG